MTNTERELLEAYLRIIERLEEEEKRGQQLMETTERDLTMKLFRLLDELKKKLAKEQQTMGKAKKVFDMGYQELRQNKK